MAVEHTKDDTQPAKLKGLQETDSAEENSSKLHNKENQHENGNIATNNINNNSNNSNNSNTTHTTKTEDETQQLTTNDEQGDSEEEQQEHEDRTQQTLAEPSNFNVKHPLQNGWTIWYDNPGKRSTQASWGDNLKKVTTFNTVEDFWRVFNNLKMASVLPQGSNYHIFKEYIEPKWEDPANSKGGKWTVTVLPKNRNSTLDQMWLYTILACIGETFSSPDDVCGAVVSVRKAADRVQIWTKDASDEQACRNIGRSLKAACDLPDSTLIGFQSHADSMKKATSQKNKYEV